MEQGTKWLYDLVDQMTGPLQGIERQLGSTDNASQKLNDNINHTADSGDKIHGVGAAFEGLGDEIIGAAAGFGLWTNFESVLDGVKDQMHEIFEVAENLEKSQLVLSNLLGDPRQAQEAEEMMHDVAMHHAQDLTQLREAYGHLVQRGFTPAKEQLIGFADVAASAGKPVGELMETITQAAESGRFLSLAQYGIVVKAAGKDSAYLTAKYHNQKTVIANNEEAIRNYVLSLGEMSGAHGLSAKMMDTLYGKEINLTNKTEDLHKSMGDLFEGALPGWMDFKIEVIEGLTDFFNWLKVHKADIKETFETIGVALLAGGTAWLAFNAEMVIGQMVAGLALGAISLLDGAVWLLNFAMEANPIGIIIGLLAALAAMIFYAWNHMEGFRVFLFALWEASKAVFKGMFDIVVLYFGGQIDIIKGFGEVLLGAIMIPFDHGKMFHQGLDDMVEGTKKLASIPDAVKKAGHDVGVAWAKGQQEGHDSFNASKSSTTANPEDAADRKSVVSTKNALGGGQDDGAGAGGSGSGSSSRNINVHIGVLGQVTVHAATIKESLPKIRQMIHEELIGSVRDFEKAINNG